MNEFRAAFSPNKAVSRRVMIIIIAAQGVLAFLYWAFLAPRIFPTPTEVISSFGKLWTVDGLGYHLIQSFTLNLWANGLTAIISLGLAYLTVLPVMRPVVLMVSKLRFLGLVGLSFIFTLMVASAWLKIALLVFGMTVFFVVSMADEVASISREQFDYARTLRMGEWRVVWEVVVLGKMDAAFDVLRQNAAIGWMMLTMVEGISRAEGGIGVLLLNQNKHMHLAEVFAINLCIVTVALVQDYAIGVAKNLACPHAAINLERK